MRYYCLLFFFIIPFFFSCKRPVLINQDDLGKADDTVFADYEKLLEPDKDILVDSMFFIKLQTTSKCLIGDIDELFFIDNTIVVVDKEISKAVFLFDMKGNFKGQVSRLGNGRNEYLKIHDVCITPEGHIAIYDIRKDKIMYFDTKGKFVKEQKLSFRFSEFDFIDSTSMVFNIIGKGNKKIYNDHTYVVTDSKLKELYFFGDDIQTESFTYRKSHGLYSYNNNVYCTINLGSIVYQVGRDSLRSAYQIDIPDNVTSYPFESDDEFFEQRNKHSFFGDYFVELKDYTVVGYRTAYKGLQFFIYEHDTKRTTLLTRKQMRNPILLFLSHPCTMYKDNIIVTVEPSSMICSYKDKIYEAYSTAYPQIVELYDGLSVDSNPVLFFYDINLKNENK